MRRSRVAAIARKEFLHIIYDPRTLLIVFVMPMIQLVMFGYAMNMEVQRVDMAVVDFAVSTESRHLIEQFRGSKYFRPFYYDGDMSQVDALFKSRRARAVMIIPADFDRRLSVDTYVPVQFLFDASDANAATVVRNYCLQILMSYNDSRGVKVSLPFDLRSTVLFNPGLQSSYFFVPGIIAMILVMISALLTSVTISREKETGTMEQILVSPVRPYEIVVGKVFPYVGLAFLSGGSTLFLGFALFHVPFRGNPLVLVGLTSLYVLCGVSLGLMISTVVRTQQVAMIAANFSTMLPTMLLSGLVFHLASIPRALQILSYLVPARYYLLIVRGIILKGSGLQALVYPTLSLALLSLVMLAISVRRFSMTLEK